MRVRFLLAGMAVFLSIFAIMSAQAQPGGGEMPPPPVEVTKAVRAPLFRTITAVGSLSANESVTLRPEVDGQITGIPFEEGQPVKAGDLLIQLDQSIPSAEARRAQSSAALGGANLKREQELKKAGYATQRRLDEARTEATSNRAQAEVANVRLSKTQVRAPFDGVAGFRSVSLGDYVRVGDDLMNLEQIDPIKATFQVPETFLSAIRQGVTVDIRVDAYPDEVFKGEIFAINPKIDPQTRSIAIRARVDNPDGRLRPGLFARISIPVDANHTSILVPETALVPTGDKMIAFRVNDGKAERLEVKMGARNSGLVEVASGLAEGDTVIVTGQMRAQDGAPVNVVNTITPKLPGVPEPVQDVAPIAEPITAPAITPVEPVMQPAREPQAAPAQAPTEIPAETPVEGATTGPALMPSSAVPPDVPIVDLPSDLPRDLPRDLPSDAPAPAAAEGQAQ